MGTVLRVSATESEGSAWSHTSSPALLPQHSPRRHPLLLSPSSRQQRTLPMDITDTHNTPTTHHTLLSNTHHGQEAEYTKRCAHVDAALTSWLMMVYSTPHSHHTILTAHSHHTHSTLTPHSAHHTHTTLSTSHSHHTHTTLSTPPHTQLQHLLCTASSKTS